MPRTRRGSSMPSSTPFDELKVMGQGKRGGDAVLRFLDSVRDVRAIEGVQIGGLEPAGRRDDAALSVAGSNGEARRVDPRTRARKGAPGRRHVRPQLAQFSVH